jgi:hypothetical protein
MAEIYDPGLLTYYYSSINYLHYSDFGKILRPYLRRTAHLFCYWELNSLEIYLGHILSFPFFFIVLNILLVIMTIDTWRETSLNSHFLLLTDITTSEDRHTKSYCLFKLTTTLKFPQFSVNP